MEDPEHVAMNLRLKRDDADRQVRLHGHELRNLLKKTGNLVDYHLWSIISLSILNCNIRNKNTNIKP